GAGRYVTIQTKTDTLTPYRRWTNRLISPVIESLSGCTSSRIKGAGIATTLTRGHETARGPAQQLRTRRVSTMIVTGMTVITLTLCAACLQHPTYSPTQQQNPGVQSTETGGSSTETGGGGTPTGGSSTNTGGGGTPTGGSSTNTGGGGTPTGGSSTNTGGGGTPTGNT